MMIIVKGWKIVSGLQELLQKDWKYTVKEYKRKRTNPQNSYLHKLFTMIADDVGDDMEFIKHYFKNKYLKRYSKKRNIEYPWNTSTLNTVEFADFVDKVLNDMSMMWYIYPTPDEFRELF